MLIESNVLRCFFFFWWKHTREQLEATHLTPKKFTYEVSSFDLIVALTLWFIVMPGGVLGVLLTCVIQRTRTLLVCI